MKGSRPDSLLAGGPGRRLDGVRVTAGEVLPIPEAGIEVPVDEFYRGISFDEAAPA